MASSTWPPTRWHSADEAPPPTGLAPASVLSLVASLIWAFGLGSFVGIVAGVYALRAIHRSHGELRGRVLAIVGIVLGVIGLVAFLMGLALVGSVESNFVT